MKSIFLLLTIFLSLPLMAEDQAPYTVFIKKGAVLTNPKNKTDLVLTKGIYAKVLEINPNKKDTFTVYDNSNQAKYLVNAFDITKVLDDYNILPRMDPEAVYPPLSMFKIEDNSAAFDSQFSIHLDTFNISGLNDVYFNEVSSASSFRYEFRTLYKSYLALEYGLCFNYQSVSWQNTDDNINLSILSFGPQFKYTLLQNEDLNFHALIGAELAPVYTGTTNFYTDKYSAILFDFGIESEWKSDIGLIEFGSHYRIHDIGLSSTNRQDLESIPTAQSISSLGFMVGYKYEWDL